jgi:membrane-associated phospholipid phosphatase
MKQLTLRFIIPLTIISFVLVTKWWYVLPIDARQTFYWGFPFAFVGEGWQTSGALQFFLLEGLADISIYFAFWFLLTSIFLRLQIIKRIHRLASGMLWSIAFFVIISGGNYHF